MSVRSRFALVVSTLCSLSISSVAQSRPLEDRSLSAAFVRAVQRFADERYDFADSASGALEAQGPHGAGSVVFDTAGRVTLRRSEASPGQPLAVAFGGLSGHAAKAVAYQVEGNEIRAEHTWGRSWWRWGPLGLQFGFVVDEAPPGASVLTYGVALLGAHRTVTVSGAALRLTDDSRSSWRVAQLYAEDARGRSLPAWLRPSSRGFDVVVDVTDADFPVEVDPVFSEEQKLTTGDGRVNDEFGLSIALDQDTAVIGAPLDDTIAGPDSGSAYVFERSNARWTEVQKLEASNSNAGDEFGASVDLDGGRLIVGAPQGDTSTVFDSGSAYIFERSMGTWSERSILDRGTLAASGEEFGHSVTILGDDAFVGAPLGSTVVFGGGQLATGVAVSFTRSISGWSRRLTFVPPNISASLVGIRFGHAVALGSGFVAIAANEQDTAAGSDVGTVHVWEEDCTTSCSWIFDETIEASNGTAFDRFGTSLAVNSSTIAVGAPGWDTLTAFDAGSGYVFEDVGGTYTEIAQVEADDGGQFDQAGSSIAITRERVVLGAPGDDTMAGANAGSAYVFEDGPGGWSQSQKLEASDGTAGALFGSAVSTDGDLVVVGSRLADSSALSNVGAAYAFTSSPPMAPNRVPLSGAALILSTALVMVGRRQIRRPPTKESQR